MLLFLLGFSQPPAQSCRFYPIVHLADGAQRAEGCTLLPGHDVAYVIARENDWTIGLDQRLVAGIDMGSPLLREGKARPSVLSGAVTSDPGAFIVGDLAPGNIHRLFQFLSVPGVQPLD